MSLNWRWNDKMGEVVYENGLVNNIYQGNAYMIVISEDKDMGTYNLCWFAADKCHLKNMLGLTKGNTNCISRYGIKKLRFNISYKTVPEIVSLFLKAGMALEIETYRESENK